MKNPDFPAPPLIGRIEDASERSLRDDWPAIERQLEVALSYAKRLERPRGTTMQNDPAPRLLGHSVREMDQYARAIRWVLTVTESEDA